MNQDPVTIRNFKNLHERDVAARLMVATDPWKTFGRTYENCLNAVSDPLKEAYGAFDDEKFLGLLVLDLTGPLKGYIQAVCITPEARGKGLASALIQFAENRIFSVSPNCFLCFSSFNSLVKPIYEHLGYELVGELKNYMIPGHSEFLMRKTTGPVMTFS